MFKLAKQAGIVLGAVAMISAANAADMSAEAIAKRIKPVGDVYLAGEAKVEVAAAPAGPRGGEQIYNTSCLGCHGTGAAGAPLKGDAAAWEPRKAQGMDVLLEHAVNGFNAMPPKGTCMDCSNEELQAAIDFMLAGN